MMEPKTNAVAALWGVGKPSSKDAPLDPLSSHIANLSRARTDPKLMAQPTLPDEHSQAESQSEPLSGAGQNEVPSALPRRLDPVLADGSKVEKKKTSLLSRIIGSKRKESVDISDDESLPDIGRIEGMEAQVFSQPVGYIPNFPEPPKYIKVRKHDKKAVDFNRLFLAQELKHAPSQGEDLPKKRGTAVWAMNFSRDGRYLAVGGQDVVVRIWSVMATAEDRAVHEAEEEAGSEHKLSAPVFMKDPVREWKGHTDAILDFSWSKNNFLLSSSMDKTVRLWHISREECLCAFKHADFVTSISFHPLDDRFFLAGSLDKKLRLWSIPDKAVAFSSMMPDLITAVAFSPDGRTAIAGCLHGICQFYDTDGLKYITQIHVRSSHGKNTKGSKVTGIQTVGMGETKILITTNDSRIRLYNLKDRSLELKFKGNQNTSSQIRATFSDNTRYIICGSEDGKVYIWNTTPGTEDRKDKRAFEFFEAHNDVVTTAIFAPTQTKQLLSASEDPVYDLCNPPPVMLKSRAESIISTPHTDSSRTDRQSFANESRPEPSAGYISRSAHEDGNIIVTADHRGRIKVFRQDCAYTKRREAMDGGVGGGFSRTFSRSGISGMKGRQPSLRNSMQRANSKSSQASMNGSISSSPYHERILSWRNSISGASFDGHHSPRLSIFNGSHSRQRSLSPEKSVGRSSLTSISQSRNGGGGTTHSSPLASTKTANSYQRSQPGTPTSNLTPIRTRSRKNTGTTFSSAISSNDGSGLGLGHGTSPGPGQMDQTAMKAWEESTGGSMNFWRISPGEGGLHPAQLSPLSDHSTKTEGMHDLSRIATGRVKTYLTDNSSDDDDNDSNSDHGHSRTVRQGKDTDKTTAMKKDKRKSQNSQRNGRSGRKTQTSSSEGSPRGTVRRKKQ